jgi:uncharacterized OB-fold protein
MPPVLNKKWVSAFRAAVIFIRGGEDEARKRHLRKAYPNGGKCHECGCDTAPSTVMCIDCANMTGW